MQRYDAVVVGAGAAGLFCAGVAAQRGLSVAIVDHAPRLAEKIRISGGGRCNFTNLEADRPERFLSEDPSFARAVLRAYGPRRFVKLVESHGVRWHEKHRGQLFCDDSSERIVGLLRAECDRGGVTWLRPCAVRDLRVAEAPAEPRERFMLDTEAGPIAARALVVATGGLSIPMIGATDWGHRIARQLGLRVVAPRPALVPLTFTAPSWQPFVELAGLGLEVRVSVPDVAQAVHFDEDLLFTHRGLSGPAILQISSYWRAGAPLSIDLAPGRRIADALATARQGARQQLGSALAAIVPRRLAQAWLGDASAGGPPPERRLAELGNAALASLAARFHDWRVVPAGTEGWKKAEVTAGGVATDELDPRTMAARRVPGLHFIGEVVDVTGWLGGYNFQWAWASGFVAAQALPGGARR
jgi:predicted Rossmann fold flavoprotein